MGKLIAGINMTLDGFCDHTAGIADNETHRHYADLLKDSGIIIWGRKTYQLMEDYWPTVVKKPTGNQALDEFAEAAENIQKIVFSRTLTHVNWKHTTIKNEVTREEIIALKKETEKDILVGSPSLIVTMTQLGLVDEYQLAIHPVILGSGLRLFRDITEKTDLTLLKTKTFGCGVVILYHRVNK